jgi:hypothetical protein
LLPPPVLKEEQKQEVPEEIKEDTNPPVYTLVFDREAYQSGN